MAGLLEEMEGPRVEPSAERAYSETCCLHCLDDFLAAIRPLLCGSELSTRSSTASHVFRVSPTPDSDE